MRECSPTTADLILDGQHYSISSLDELRVARSKLAGHGGAHWVDFQGSAQRLFVQADLGAQERWRKTGLKVYADVHLLGTGKATR